MNVNLIEKKQDSESDSVSFDISSFAQEDVARLIIGENGKIAYTSEEFGDMADRSSYAMVGIMARDVLHFVNPEDALEASIHAIDMQASKNPGRDIWTNSILGGVHDVFLWGDSEKYCKCRFDWVKLPDGRRFLIASTDAPSVVGKADMADEVKSLIQNKVPSVSKGFSQNQDMQILMSLSHESMVVFDKTGQICSANDAFLEILSQTTSSLVGSSLVSFVHSDDKMLFETSMKEMQDGPVELEVRMIDSKGKTKCIDWLFKSLGGRTYASGRDLTEIKLKEETIAKRQAQLREAQSIGRMGHWYWKIGDECFDFSNEIYRIFGVVRGEFQPTLENITAMVHKQDVDRMIQILQRAMIERQNYDMEFRIRQENGDIRHIHCEGRSEIDDDGDVNALFGIMQDITERHQHEADLRAAKESAERAYSTKSQFLANMSHELRTPLNAIIGFSEMMERQLLGPIGTEKYMDYITGIRESGVHLLDLISDILDMSKIEAGKYDLDLEDVNVGKTINLALHMMEGRALESSIKLSTNIGEEGPIVKADRRAVMQVVLNLLSNAVKFSKDEGQVSVECHKRDNYVAIKVIDNGVGIPADRLSVVTKPFEQAANALSRDHEGSGLGLAITKELIDLHGGNMRIESQVDEGTTVTVRLPYEAITE